MGARALLAVVLGLMLLTVSWFAALLVAAEPAAGVSDGGISSLSAAQPEAPRLDESGSGALSEGPAGGGPLNGSTPPSTGAPSGSTAGEAYRSPGDSTLRGTYGWPGDSLLSAYIAEALAKHPEILGEEAMVKEAEAQQKTASSWMNPMAVLGIMDAPTNLDLSKDPMTEKQVGLMQTVPWPGKLSLGKRAARQGVEEARQTLESARWKQRAMVTMTYFKLAGLLEQKKALEKTLELAEEALRATGIALSSGMESQANFVQARVEKTRTARELVSLQSQIDQARAELAYTVGRVDVGATNADELKDPQLPSDLGSLPPLNREIAAIEKAPTLRALEADSLASYLEWKKSRLAYFPDVTVGARYGFGGKMIDEIPGKPGTFGWVAKENRISVEISFAIPLWAGGNQNAQIAEQKAHLEKASAALANERIELLLNFQKTYLEAQSAAQQFKITRDSLLVPAQMAYRAAILDYQAGKLPWMNLNNIRISLSMLRMELAMEAADYLMKKAELEGAIGRILQ
jgi:outer membrane protein, heavy metal efflux system